MAAFYILVLDRYLASDPGAWVYSASASTQAALLALQCYDDPPLSLPRATFVAESSVSTAKPPCQGGREDTGSIVGINHA